LESANCKPSSVLRLQEPACVLRARRAGDRASGARRQGVYRGLLRRRRFQAGERLLRSCSRGRRAPLHRETGGEEPGSASSAGASTIPVEVTRVRRSDLRLPRGV